MADLIYCWTFSSRSFRLAICKYVASCSTFSADSMHRSSNSRKRSVPVTIFCRSRFPILCLIKNLTVLMFSMNIKTMTLEMRKQIHLIHVWLKKWCIISLMRQLHHYDLFKFHNFTNVLLCTFSDRIIESKACHNKMHDDKIQRNWIIN